MCGGTSTPMDSPVAVRGLSPRVRGNLAGVLAFPLPAGSIPACAGEPRVRSIESVCAGVYPRVCGGTAGRKSGDIKAMGLSPRVRGNPGASWGV